MSNSPFDVRPRSPGIRNLRAGLLAAALLGTVVFVYFMTRRRPDARTAAAGHVSENVSAERAEPVMLTDRERKRIGVTFVEALGPVPLDHIPDPKRDLVLGDLRGSLHVPR